MRKEGKNLTFIEDIRTITGNGTSSMVAPQAIEVDADKANASAFTGGTKSSAFPVKFTNLADPQATATGTGVPPAPITKSMKKLGYQSNAC